MVIVAGYLVIESPHRDSYLSGCTAVQQARATPGCLDYAISADPLDPDRIRIFERWESRAAVEVFRGSGPSDDHQQSIVGASVSEYDVANERLLT
jgi:quinol monooxygenase YgiN